MILSECLSDVMSKITSKCSPEELYCQQLLHFKCVNFDRRSLWYGYEHVRHLSIHVAMSRPPTSRGQIFCDLMLSKIHSCICIR
jgi:hypothetical protein